MPDSYCLMIFLTPSVRKVNAVTQTLSFYMPTIDEIVDVIGQSKVISKLDLTKDFLQVKMKVSDKEKPPSYATEASFNTRECHLE